MQTSLQTYMSQSSGNFLTEIVRNSWNRCSWFTESLQNKMKKRYWDSFRYCSDGRKSSENTRLERPYRGMRENHPASRLSQTEQESISIGTDGPRFEPLSNLYCLFSPSTMVSGRKRLWQKEKYVSQKNSLRGTKAASLIHREEHEPLKVMVYKR